MSSRLVIGISGGVGVGKSTIVKDLEINLREKGLEVSLLEIDSYYKDLSEENYINLKKINFDLPETIDFDNIYEDLDNLKNGFKINMPVYNMKTSKREKGICKMIFPADIIIIEGIHSFYDKRLLNLIDFKVFLECRDEETQYLRKVDRDIKERGRIKEEIIQYINEFSKHTHKNLILPTKIHADLVVYTDEITIKDSVELILKILKKKLNKH